MLRAATKYLLHSGPGMRAVRWLRRKGVVILNYHEFRPENRANLRRHCEYLRQYYRVVSMRDLAQSLCGGAPLPPNAVILTVDDGHRNFCADAYPVFREYSCPVTMYLATGFIDSGGWLWFDRLEYAAVHSPSPAVTLPQLCAEPGSGPRCIALPDSSAARVLLAISLANRLKALPCRAFEPALSSLIDAFGTRLPDLPPAEYAPLSWQEARAMFAEGGVEFGAHTVSHPILSRIEDAGALSDEILGSKTRVESELQAPVLHFAYPNGRPADIGLQVRSVVRRAGFRTAVTTVPGQIGGGADPLLLNRVTVGSEYPLPYFKQRVAVFPA